MFYFNNDCLNKYNNKTIHVDLFRQQLLPKYNKTIYIDLLQQSLFVNYIIIKQYILICLTTIVCKLYINTTAYVDPNK